MTMRVVGDLDESGFEYVIEIDGGWRDGDLSSCPWGIYIVSHGVAWTIFEVVNIG